MALPVRDHGFWIAAMKKTIPNLSYNSRKGQSGRVAIVGGCVEYTGAPYFAAIAALRAGCDLVHVFCAPEAAPVIKSYSPELIVHPLLGTAAGKAALKEWLPRMHAVVVGPGLGRDPPILETVDAALTTLKPLSTPLILDADGLFFINTNQHYIKGRPNTILTPNAVEFSRLHEAVTGTAIAVSSAPDPDTVKAVAARLGHITILHKAESDVISDGKEIVICDKQGSPRRCGGQGDLLSGILATFFNWSSSCPINNQAYSAALPAAYSASCLMRTVSSRAFEIHLRGTLASDMIPLIPQGFSDLLD